MPPSEPYSDAYPLGDIDPDWYADAHALEHADATPVTVPNGDPYAVRFAYAYADALTDDDPDGSPFRYAHAFGYAYGLAQSRPVAVLIESEPEPVLQPGPFTDRFALALDQYADWITESDTSYPQSYSPDELDTVTRAAHAYAAYVAAHGRQSG